MRLSVKHGGMSWVAKEAAYYAGTVDATYWCARCYAEFDPEYSGMDLDDVLLDLPCGREREYRRAHTEKFYADRQAKGKQ